MRYLVGRINNELGNDISICCKHTNLMTFLRHQYQNTIWNKEVTIICHFSYCQGCLRNSCAVLLSCWDRKYILDKNAYGREFQYSHKALLQSIKNLIRFKHEIQSSALFVFLQRISRHPTDVPIKGVVRRASSIPWLLKEYIWSATGACNERSWSHGFSPWVDSFGVRCWYWNGLRRYILVQSK